jgi:membrane protein YdbS with pleckstrin-like domain
MTMSQIPPTSSAATGTSGLNAPHREADDSEEIYYQGSPMVRGNMGKIFFWFLFGLVLIAAPIAYYFLNRTHEWPIWWITLACVAAGLIMWFIPVLIVKSVRYRITNYRIDFERGIFGKKIDTLELWHVEDIRFDQSFLDRLLGVGNLLVVSSDETTPQLRMHGLPNPRPLFDTLKQRVIAVKRQRGVVKMDIGHDPGVIPNT